MTAIFMVMFHLVSSMLSSTWDICLVNKEKTTTTTPGLYNLSVMLLLGLIAYTLLVIPKIILAMLIGNYESLISEIWQ